MMNSRWHIGKESPRRKRASKFNSGGYERRAGADKQRPQSAASRWWREGLPVVPHVTSMRLWRSNTGNDQVRDGIAHAVSVRVEFSVHMFHPDRLHRGLPVQLTNLRARK